MSEDKTYELGNGNYLRVDPVGGVAIYNEDNIVCLNDRQTFALKAALLESQATSACPPIQKRYAPDAFVHPKMSVMEISRQQYDNAREDREGLAKRCIAAEELLLGMIGLVQLLSHNTDIPACIRKDMLTNHRYIDAVAFGPVAGIKDTECFHCHGVGFLMDRSERRQDCPVCSASNPGGDAK